jgi:DNA-binding MarR family transcriptional regulator
VTERAAFAIDWEDFILAIRRARARSQEDEDLSLSQWDLLRALADRQEMSCGELATAAGISAPTVTGVLDGLERAGVVKRRRPAHNRRIVTVTLTDEGRARLERKHKRITDQGTRVFKSLEPDERERAGRLLRRLTAVVSEL